MAGNDKYYMTLGGGGKCPLYSPLATPLYRVSSNLNTPASANPRQSF